MKDWTISHHQRVGGFIWPLFVIMGLMGGAGCAGLPHTDKDHLQSGRNQVWLEKDPESTTSDHPANLSPEEIGTLLRGVRSWESRNVIHRLFPGEAEKTLSVSCEEITSWRLHSLKHLRRPHRTTASIFISVMPPSRAMKESTSGWLSIRQDALVLALSRVHDRHGPQPDISKYDRQMPERT